MIDLDEQRLNVAQRSGATATVNSREGNAAKQVMALTQGRGVDTAIEAVGIPATFQRCQDIVAAGGTLTTRLVDTVSIPMWLKTVQSQRIDASQRITHRFKMSQMMQAYETFSNAVQTQALKVIIEA